MLRLEGKVAIVTGLGTGIGRGTPIFIQTMENPWE